MHLTLSTSQLSLATFQVANRHTQPVATVLDSWALQSWHKLGQVQRINSHACYSTVLLGTLRALFLKEFTFKT